jgi:PQQ-like domain
MERRILVVAAMSAAVLGMLGAVTPGIGTQPGLAATENSPWFGLDYNAARSRANLTEKVLSSTAVTKIKYLRSVAAAPLIPLKANCTGWIVGPVLAGGSMYAMTNAELSKYNAATGALVWRRIPDPSFSNAYVSVAVSGNLVIVAGSTCDGGSTPAGTVWAYDTSTGALMWTSGLRIGNEIDGAVVVSPYVVAEGVDAFGYASGVINLSNGQLIWQLDGCGPSSPPIVVGQVVMSGGACDAQGNKIIEANSLATGAPLWSLPVTWKLQRGDTAGAAGKHLYATNPAGTIVDLNPQTGKTEYSLSTAAAVLAVDNLRVYASCGSQAQYLCAYNIGTGALAWQNTQLRFPPGYATEAGGVLYVKGEALNAATGKVITTLAWQAQSGVYYLTPSAIGDGRIAASSGAGVIDLFGLPGY